MVEPFTLWHYLIELIGDRVVMPLALLANRSGDGIDSREIATSLLISVIHIGIILLVFRPLESWLPAERWTARRLTRVDRQYTLLIVLGAAPLAFLIALMPLRDMVAGGTGPSLLASVPWLDHHPYLQFFAYYLVFDFVYYWMHRAEHAIPWWWALHSLHHSQRQLSCWSNDRDCFLSGLFEALILASVGLLLGVEPSEFALLMLAGELIQDFSHTNVRVGFGKLGGKLIVGPDFHRLHHMRADPKHLGRHRCNFAQAFPLWDILFGTALYAETPQATGVTDPTIDTDNDLGLVGQQQAALRRFWGAIWRRAGWIPGDVSFGADYKPIADAEGIEH